LLKIVSQNQNREEIKKINLELSRVDASAGRMQDVERDIRNTVRKLLGFTAILCIITYLMCNMNALVIVVNTCVDFAETNHNLCQFPSTTVDEFVLLKPKF